MNHEHNQSCENKKCGCMCHNTTGVFIVLVGLVFLLGNLDVIGAKTVSIAWPVLVMAAGLSKLCKGMCKCCKK